MPFPSRPLDATLTVTKAARLLGVHPNTVRAWSDAGRLRYYRINPRGDRRYRIGDLQRFLASAANGGDLPVSARATRPGRRKHAERWGRSRDRQAARSSGALQGDWSDTPTATLVADIGDLAARALRRDAPALDELLAAAVVAVREALGVALAVAWQLDGDRLVPRAASGSGAARIGPRPVEGTSARSLEAAADDGDPAPVVEFAPRRSVGAGLGPELAVAVQSGDRTWGVLTLVGTPVAAPGAIGAASVTARAIGLLLDVVAAGGHLGRRAHRAEALRRVAADIGSRLDVDQIAAGLLEHALVLFGADRGAVVLGSEADGAAPVASRGLSAGWLATMSRPSGSPLREAARARGAPAFSVGYRDDPRGIDQRAAVVQEGFDTVCSATLSAGDDELGSLTLYHDRPHHWTDEELEALRALASQTSVAIRTARDYGVMAQWAAQLQSIQQLGARLNRLTKVADIGLAIATELRELIDYHNVRVYRLAGDDLVPVAMKGQVGEYHDEQPDQLRVLMGQGITGWVAEHQVPVYLPDAARDPRAHTIPGTEDDLDESMLLAPMVFEDQVLGVVVLSKLGLNQFGDDDLRLLVIYASFAAQAMANADATEQLHERSAALERQLRSQRELLQITESILTTLQPRAVLDQIADRLSELVGYDNISIEVYDRQARVLRPLTARGVHAAHYLEPWEVGEQGVATWVIEHNEPTLIVDQYDDPRVRHFDSVGRIHGGLVVVPLRGRQGATGVLTVERLGEGNTFGPDEFELIQLFAAQVSIALQNAEEHRAVEIKARTDDLTGLLNHGTFRDRLAHSVARDQPFGLVMIDLDTFKSVNDRLGHQAGDRLLSEIAAAIVGASRESDAVFRYGGDEFTIVLPGADADAAAAVAERVRSAVHAIGAPGTRWGAAGVGVSASFGVAVFPGDGETPEAVLLAADRACLVAKRAGHGRIVTADEGLRLAAEVTLQEPTPVDPPSMPAA